LLITYIDVEIPERLIRALDDDRPNKARPDVWPAKPHEKPARLGGVGKHRARGIRFLQNHLGRGDFTAFLYFTLANAQNPAVCVCLGSGRGTIAALMREGQLSSYGEKFGQQESCGKREDSRTYLVDAGGLINMNECSEEYVHNKNSLFRANYPDIEVLRMFTSDSCLFFRDKGIKIDYLHIDAGHTYEDALNDFKNFYEKYDLMAEDFIITMHDTGLERRTKGGGHRTPSEVQRALSDIRDMYKELDVVDFHRDPKYGRGTAIIKTRPQISLTEKDMKSIASRVNSGLRVPEADLKAFKAWSGK
jgi:hypothetical protein